MHTTIKFAKTNPNAKIPTKRLEDAGYDIYACFDEDYMIINPHETKMIPTGIASACDTDYAFILKERGSTGTKGIAQRCGVIDSGFRNAWIVPICNTTDKTLIIYKNNQSKSQIIEECFGTNGEFTKKADSIIFYPYEKAIAQAILVPVPTTDIEEYTYEELQKIPSERGKGMLGSSNK